MHGKNKDDVYDEFDRETQNDGETVTKYIERLEVNLSSPAGKFKRGDVCAFIWEKLPQYYKSHIDCFAVGTSFTRFRRWVNTLERDTTHRELREVLERTGVNTRPSLP